MPGDRWVGLGLVAGADIDVVHGCGGKSSFGLGLVIMEDIDTKDQIAAD